MKVVILGIQRLSFTSKDGDEINGLKIHFSADPSDNQKDNFIGQTTDTQWVKANSDVLLFGKHASKIFENWSQASSVLPSFPVKCDLLFGLEGRKVVFEGIKEIKS